GAASQTSGKQSLRPGFSVWTVRQDTPASAAPTRSGFVQSAQTGFDVSAALPIGQLGKRHKEMFGAAQRLDVTSTAIPLDNPRKCRPWQKIHQLGEQRLARKHRPLRERLPGK